MDKPFFKENTAITHPGKFHADDVFASALLKLLNPNIEIIRTSNIPNFFKGIVFDIGLGEFDHHQKNNERRKNGIPYASFGKLWRAFGLSITNQTVVNSIDKHLVQPIDEADNGRGTNLLSIMISRFNPAWNEDDAGEEYFDFAVSVALCFLKAEIKIEEMRASGKISGQYSEIDDVNNAVKRFFSEPIIKAMCLTSTGSVYKEEIRRCMRFECGKDFPCDNHGEPCSPLSNVWREYGSIVTAGSVMGSVMKSFFNSLDEVTIKNKKKDALLCLMNDISAHSPEYMDQIQTAIQKWLSIEIEAAESRFLSREILVNAIRETKDDEIIILDKFCPWRDVLIDSLAKFVVYPSVRGGYNMHTVPISRTDSSARLPYPDTWCTSPIEKVQKTLPDITFCHRGNFLITSNTIEGCYEAAEISSDDFINSSFNQDDIRILNIAKKSNFYSSSLLESEISKLTMGEAGQLLDRFSHVYFRKKTEKEGLILAQELLKQHINRERFVSSLNTPLDQLLGYA